MFNSLYGDKREEYRENFFNVWFKYKNSKPLDRMEKRILDILLRHKEYMSLLDDPEKNLDNDFFPELGETNPFLHISLHLTISEQVIINQPKGIRGLYKKCINSFEDVHEAEHCIMNSLAMGIHEIMSESKPFDEKKYLQRIKKALRDGQW